MSLVLVVVLVVVKFLIWLVVVVISRASVDPVSLVVIVTIVLRLIVSVYPITICIVISVVLCRISLIVMSVLIIVIIVLGDLLLLIVFIKISLHNRIVIFLIGGSKFRLDLALSFMVLLLITFKYFPLPFILKIYWFIYSHVDFIFNFAVSWLIYHHLFSSKPIYSLQLFFWWAILTSSLSPKIC